MEPFDIRSTPARIGAMTMVGIVFLFLVTAAVLAQLVWSAVVLITADERTLGRVLLLVPLLALAALCVWLAHPQVLMLRRYFGEDRGKQVLTFRLDQEGWRWMQVGTDVLMPWDRLRISVVDRTEEFVTIRLECAEPLLVGTDVLSKVAYRNLKRRTHTDVPFTHANPTEDELADAIAAQSGGRVVLERRSAA